MEMDQLASRSQIIAEGRAKWMDSMCPRCGGFARAYQGPTFKCDYVLLCIKETCRNYLLGAGIPDQFYGGWADDTATQVEWIPLSELTVEIAAELNAAPELRRTEARACIETPELKSAI